MQRRSGRPAATPAQRAAKGISSFAFVMCIIVIAIIFLFYQHKKSDKTETDTVVSTEIEKLTAKDLVLGYPATPTEVLKLVGRINQCIYNNGGMADEDIDKLLNQLRVMYSTKLLEQNTFEEQKNKLMDELNEFSKEKRKIVNYSVDKSSTVKYDTVDGQECAYLQVVYFMAAKGKYSKSYQDYVLVKENNDWKILAFQKSNAPKQTVEKSKDDEKNKS